MADSHYIDPEIRPLLEQMAANYGDFSKLSVAETRAMFAQTAAATARPLPDDCVDDFFEVPGPAGPIPCRLFRPAGATGALPVVVLFLSGTYVATSLDQVGNNPVALVQALGCMVVTPLHRIPPEAPFPAAYDDCFAVYRWLLENGGVIGGNGAIVLLGESSGATLAASVCIDAREAGLAQPRLQVLAEPLLDHQSETPSINEFAYVLSKADIRRGSALYFGDQPPPPRASPLRADRLAGVAPAYVITAGLDPLRDEGFAFVARLRAEGVTVAHRNHEGQVHGFFSMHEQLTQARIAFRECCAAIQLAFEGGLLPK